MKERKKALLSCWATEKWTRDYDRRRSERERERILYIPFCCEGFEWRHNGKLGKCEHTTKQTRQPRTQKVLSDDDDNDTDKDDDDDDIIVGGSILFDGGTTTTPGGARNYYDYYYYYYLCVYFRRYRRRFRLPPSPHPPPPPLV